MSEVFHERQCPGMCAIHTVNNILQNKVFTKADFDRICTELTPKAWFNPHRYVLGFGNYDVNVIMSALQSRGFETKWFDKRRRVSSLNLDVIFGFMLNVPNSYRVMGVMSIPFNLKHWLALRFLPQSDAYFNLDSKLQEPARIGKAQDFLAYLEKELSQADHELLVVVSRKVAEDQSWINH